MDADGGGRDAPMGADAGPIPPGMVDVTLAVGRGGRSMISCDEGRTWIENRIETEPMVRCWGQPSGAEPEFLDPPDNTMPNPNYLECDHDEGNTTGLVFHRGAFFRSIGWGTPGRTERSVDGVTWEPPAPSFATTYLGLVGLPDALVAMGTPQPFASSDEGASWQPTEATLGWGAGHVRAATSSNYGPMGSIVFVTDMGMWWSDDRGVTFHGPETPACDGRRFASDGPSGVGVTIVTGGDGTMCTTSDGGRTWQSQSLATSWSGNPVWNGTAFHAWGATDAGFTHFSSTDGVTWTRTSVASIGLGTVGTTVLGHFVGTNGVWNGGYENQRFFRSDDGDTWETLATDGSAFVPGHPISTFRSGVVAANAYCPAR